MATMVNMNTLLNGKDSRWLQLEVCREFQRNKCSRQDTECKFAHPPANVEVQNGKVTACYDSIKGRCNRDKPPCKYFHPPQHLKDQLLINGRNHLALKNALMQQMGIAPGQPVIPGQVPTVATNPYLTGIPANTYSPYFAPGHLVPTILGPDPSAVASQLGPVVPQAVPVAQQKIPRSDRLEVCREFMRGACKRAESECRFAHPQESVTTHEDGSVTVCMDAVKGRCARDPCRYFHPPLHLQAQIKAAQSRATATAPVSAATHPIPTPGAAPPPNAVTIGHPLEVGKKRAAENDMFQLMDVKTVGSFYYENFAFSNMVPYKRPAAEKSGIPVYQPGATTYQQLMQLQQPFVPVSCEYQSQNPSATTAIPQPQTSTTANPIIANNNTNNHSMINNNNNFILNNFNHLNNNNKTSQVNLNLNSVQNSIASNGILSNNSHHNLNISATIATTSTTTIAIPTTTMSNSNNSNGVVVSNSSNNTLYSLNNTISSNTSSGLLANNLTNPKQSIESSITPVTTVNTTQSQSSTITNTLNLSFSSSSPTVSSPTEISSASSISTPSGSVTAATSALQLSGSDSNSSQILYTHTNTATSPTNEDNNDALTIAVTNANANASDSNISAENASNAADADAMTTSANSSVALLNNTTNSTSSTTTLPTQVTLTSTDNNNTSTLTNGLVKYEQTNGSLAITTTATITEATTSAPATPSISYPITTPNRVYAAPHTSYANVLVPHHHHLYTPVSSVASTSSSHIPYSMANSAYSYASYPTQTYATQTYPNTSYYTDPATIAKEVAQKNYANAVKMAAASNALSGKPLTAALNYTGLPLNKTYMSQNQAAAAAAYSHHHHQQQQAAAVAHAAAAAQAAQVAGLRMGSHSVGSTMGTPVPTPVSTPSLLQRPPAGYLSASPMMRPQQMSLGASATTTNPYAAAAAAAAAAANQQYLQQHQQHFFYPGMMAGYPFPMSAAAVPGLTSAATMSGMQSQMQAAQVAQAAAAVAAAQAGAQASGKLPSNASYVIYTDENGQLLDTLPVCQDFNRSMCSRLNCRFVHLTEDDKVEVCDQRVAVCRDHANGQCRRKLCKYYHIPVVLPPANIMATIFNQQSVQQPTQHQQQLTTTSTITSIEQDPQQQQLSITTNNNTRANPPNNTSLNNHNNNNNLVNNFNNNNILYNNNDTKNEMNTLTSQQQQHQHYNIPSSISPSITLHTTPAATTTPVNLVNASTSSSFTALTTSTTTMPTPMATATTNLSAATLAATYNPTFQNLLKTHPILSPSLAYYELSNSGINDYSTNCLSLLPANPSYAAAPILYPTATTLAVQQHRHQQLTPNGRGTSGLINTTIGQQHLASNLANMSAIITTTTAT